MPLEYYKKAMAVNFHIVQGMALEGTRAILRAQRLESNRTIAKHTTVRAVG